MVETRATAGTAGADARVCPVCGAALPAGAAIRGVDRLLATPGEFEVRTCANCGSGVTSPLVAPEVLGNYYSGGYGSYTEPTRGVYATVSAALKRAQVRLLLRKRPLSKAVERPPARALDVGCARGDLGEGLGALGWSVDGIEPSRAAAALAASRGVRVLGPALASVRLEPQSYDLVVLRHSLEHLTTPLADMRLLADALSPAGIVVISLPNFASWQRTCFSSRWFHLDLPRHRVHFTPHSLRQLLEGAGLRVQEQFTSTSVLGLPASVQYTLVGRCLAPGGLGLRAAAALCCCIFPLTWVIDGAAAERDTLHVIARRA